MTPTKKVMPIGQRFQPGNPGRPKGSRNKLGEAFIQALYEDFTENGAETIQRVRVEDPTNYIRVCAGILPKELEVKSGLGELTDEELINAVELLRLAIAADDAATLPVGNTEARVGKPH